MAVDTASTSPGLTPARLQITGAIRQASNATGTSFEYLLAAAKIESNLNPSAAASTSSARGLYQFIEQTWLGTVKEAGGSLGYGQYANAITKLDSGRYVVSDPSMRESILKLRDDPVASAAMAGVLTQSNSAKLSDALGRKPSNGELYIAHFLGVGGASKMIASAETTPYANAVSQFPSAAAANRSIFYDRGGRARTVGEVYNVLTGRYASAANAPVTQTAMAAMNILPAGAAATTPAASGVEPVSISRNATFLTAFPQVAATDTATASAAPSDATPAQNRVGEPPMFRTLFQGGERAEPVSPGIQRLWESSRTTAMADSAGRTRSGFDLFSDPSGRYAG